MTIPLTVLGDSDAGAGGAGRGARARPRSRMGVWRAAVLVLVHVLIGLHVAQWIVSGMSDGVRETISPIEPSEAMLTLEHGRVNAGFVIFVLAIISTLIMGRFFCGWACHVVALQDLCAHLMHRVGLHPKPFRSRLLLWVPLGLALYMFVWPTVRREVIAPVVGVAEVIDGVTHYTLDGTWRALLGEVHPLRGFNSAFVVSDFWATFPPWYVAVPFLFVCGFACVYFLGAKGFCTYGCPYGGFFAPADRLAPVRIRVTEACNQCGHCTAVCTSNVRVSEEVRDYGSVVDPGCMKCLDCVSACPNDALYVGLGAPAVMTKPRAGNRASESAGKRARRYDLTWREEFAAAACFMVMLVAFRGLYDMVPLLMAVGLAACGTFVLFKAWRTLRDANVRAPFRQLKLNGRLTGAGVVFLCVAAGVAVLTAQGLTMSLAESHGAFIENTMEVPRERVLAPGYVPEPAVKEQAERAIASLRLAGSMGEGGVGFATTFTQRVRMAWLACVAGDLAMAEGQLRRAINARPRDDLVLDLARVMELRGVAAADVDAMLAQAVDAFPSLEGVRQFATRRLVAAGRAAEARQMYERAIAVQPGDVATLRGAAGMHAALGDGGRAWEIIESGLSRRPLSPGLRADAALLLVSRGEAERAAEMLGPVLERRPRDREVRPAHAAVLRARGKVAEARAVEEELARERARRSTRPEPKLQNQP
ncbi:MAG: 4Fe-4S binding protein [Planctomyces sp.]